MHLNTPVHSTFVYIVGLGWLGTPLATKLLNYDYQVSGTVRSISKQSQLKSRNLNADILNLTPTESVDYTKLTNFEEGIQHSKQNIVVINIPPGRQSFNKDAHVQNMKALIDYFINKGVDKLIFISTTSVYGNAKSTVNLQTAVQPQTDSAQAHVEIENYILKNYCTRGLIVRPAGLVGPNIDGTFRHPVYTLVKKEKIKNGLEPVNLVHQEDLINAIIRSIAIDITGKGINLACLDNPTKQDYYTWCATKLALPTPYFENDQLKVNTGKKIDASESLKMLGNLKLGYPSVFDLLNKSE